VAYARFPCQALLQCEEHVCGLVATPGCCVTSTQGAFVVLLFLCGKVAAVSMRLLVCGSAVLSQQAEVSVICCGMWRVVGVTQALLLCVSVLRLAFGGSTG
jgi:hypothetical protein